MRRLFVAFAALLPALPLLSTAACGGSGGSGGDGGGGGGGLTNVTDCAQIKTNSCWSNLDCADTSTRCEVVGKDPSAAPIACCTAGDRGTGKGGDPCQRETDCETGACVYGASGTYCSPTCMSDADCPAALPLCFAIDPSVGTGKFCGYPG